MAAKDQRRGFRGAGTVAILCVALLAAAGCNSGSRGGNTWLGGKAKAQFLPEGQFFVTGEMNTPRYYHTATTLDDGSVLILGGSEERLLSGLDSVEIFQPILVEEPKPESLQGAFLDTDFEGNPIHMNEGPRIYHTATRLVNGKVLILGGAPDALVGAGVSKVEIYDPLTRTFETLEKAMKDPRFRHTTIYLSSGKLALFGGQISVEETVIDPNYPVNDPRFMQQINTYPSTREIILFDPTLLDFEKALDFNGRQLELQSQRGRAGHGVVRIAGIDQELGGGVDVYVLAGGFQTLSPLFAPQTKLPRDGDLTNITALEFFHPGQRLVQRAQGAGLQFGRVNDPLVMNLGEFRSRNIDGEPGVSNCFIVMAGDDNDPFGSIDSIIEQEVFAASFTGQGPGDGIRFFRQQPNFGGMTAASMMVTVPQGFGYINSHVFNIERLFLWGDYLNVGDTQRAVMLDSPVTLDDGTVIPAGWVIEDAMVQLGVIEEPLPDVIPVDTEFKYEIGRSHAPGLVLPRLVSVRGRPAGITTPFIAGGVELYTCLAGQCYWFEEPVSGGSFFDPFFTLLNYNFQPDVHEGGWRIPTLLPYDTDMFLERGNVDFNPAGIVGCFLVTDGDVPANDWNGFAGLWPFPETQEAYELFAMEAPRAWFAMAVIGGVDGVLDTSDDRVLLAGGGGVDGLGKNGGMPIVPSAEIYVPPPARL